MAKGISGGVIKEAIQKLGGATDDIAKSVNNLADVAKTMDNPRAAFKGLVDEFGGIKYGDGLITNDIGVRIPNNNAGFTMRNSNLYGSNAPVYTGQNFKTIKAHNGVDVIAARPSAQATSDGRLLIGKNQDPLLLEMKDTSFTMGADTTQHTPIYGKGGKQLPEPVNRQTPATLNNGPTAEDLGRNAYNKALDEDIAGYQDVYNKMNEKQKYMDEWFRQHNQHNDGTKMNWFERRANKKNLRKEGNIAAAERYANMKMNGGVSDDTDGIGVWAKRIGLVTAGAIAGSVLSDND